MIVCMTPHPVVVEMPDGQRVTFPPCGAVPRVEQSREAGSPAFGIPVVVARPGEIVGIPAPVAGTVYVVSTMVAQVACRADIVAPDTGPTAIRDSAGHIVAVRGFVRFPAPEAIPVATIEAAMAEHEMAVAMESSGYMAACLVDSLRRRMGIGPKIDLPTPGDAA